MVIYDKLRICGINFHSEMRNTLLKNFFGVNKFSLFNSECINHTNHPFTQTIAISDIALLNVINKELNIITTLGMNKEH